jgi:sugar-phosphatase
MIELRLPEASGARVLRCRGVLFDMDGTLVDSRVCVERTWRAWAARHGIDYEALMQVAHGRQNHETLRLVAPHLDAPAELAVLVRAEEECQEGLSAVPGAAALLGRLPAGAWAVVTSAWRRLAEMRLRAAGLPVPPVLVTAEDVLRSKPDPEGYLAAAGRLGIAPADCVVVEDAPAGIAAGRAAGMTVVGITTTFSMARLGCSVSIDDFLGVTVGG